MEVRLSDFAEIVGTTTATVRNAIQLNKLPFLDTHRQNEETKQKVSRRTYSAADGFAWFLHDEAGKMLGIGQWAMAGIVQAAWPRGLRIYTGERLAAKSSDDSYLIIASKMAAADGSRPFLEVVLPRLSPADGADNLAQILEAYPVASFVRLDPIFERYVQTLDHRGWSVDEAGFHRIGEI